MKKIYCLVVACLVFFSAKAEISELTFEQQCWPDAYSASDCKMITDPASPCNKAGEAFSDFLQKWNDSLEFRLQRVGEYPGGISKVETAQSLNDDTDSLFGLLPTKSVKGVRKAKCATFYGVTENFVGYAVWKAFPNEFVGYLLFSRDTDDGLWYVVEINYY